MAERNGQAHDLRYVDRLSEVGGLVHGGNNTGEFPFTSHAIGRISVANLQDISNLVGNGQPCGAFPFDSFDTSTGAESADMQSDAVEQDVLASDRLTAVGTAILEFID